MMTKQEIITELKKLSLKLDIIIKELEELEDVS